ncbi:aspartate aminotransferase [Halanaerobium congolense]|uniref:Aspartate aminotransferase n=1 Tax=Halanaerobium congolense TaxID=54121 RepID=A0A1G6SNZ8_9FIRM|nr:alanine--glyoxylate aminotransferase family protein [Halanaerobium congolense]PTX17950.1 aspartate aminotransferase-like enzyme [Halanaerobium congolense]SDD17835.1 aspartate aminotransferase [Halanaerobium congolense]SDF98901.1 aspartate aminotransferase [Halanaerobium congolense]SET17315.1 aspartate aminotransferase [Halanaerobium congolense]SFP65244.1 aspartate aminotransferase [Halanaerobium congolense]
MSDLLIMTPGPTEVSEEVRRAMSQKITNPDLDPDFFDFYLDVSSKLQQVIKTKNDVIIMSGEGILGLESACASLIEPGDKVLVLDNGIFGRGFADFADLYGAEVTKWEFPYNKEIDTNELAEKLAAENDFKFATFVHCETPTGIINNIGEITKLLNEHNILSVVDSVSAIGGVPIEVDEWGIDIILGGSQKCLSVPPGLTFMSVSDAAWDAVNNRETPVRGYYTNLQLWQNWYEEKYFPYTQAISDIYALNAALDKWLEDKEIFVRHNKIAEAVRKAITESNLNLFAENGHSDTVTAIEIPDSINYQELNQLMTESHNVMIAASLGEFEDKLIRIGHMGENCYEEKLYRTLKAFDHSLRELGFNLNVELHKVFINKMD